MATNLVAVRTEAQTLSQAEGKRQKAGGNLFSTFRRSPVNAFAFHSRLVGRRLSAFPFAFLLFSL
jgi:hypothetical protein